MRSKILKSCSSVGIGSCVLSVYSLFFLSFLMNCVAKRVTIINVIIMHTSVCVRARVGSFVCVCACVQVSSCHCVINFTTQNDN